MLTLMTGNILESGADCLVNTVNCEGFMGKGLAYQFKTKFPEANKSYVKACRENHLAPGKMHCYKDNGKLIVNFPTKDKWRKKSKIEYIDNGMKALIQLIKQENIESIAIPPLGSGNGGLSWEEVKKIIYNYAIPISNDMDVYIYEPSLSYKAEIKKAPKLTLSHMILMNIKQELQKFSKFRLQKTAFFINLFSGQNYFKFKAHHYGPYSHSIEILSRDIKEFQEYHKFTTEKSLTLVHQTLTSAKIEKDLLAFSTPTSKATKLINSHSSDKEIELYSTISYIVLNHLDINRDIIVKKIHEWSDTKKDKFSKEDINKGIQELLNIGIIQQDVLGNYKLSV